MNDSDFAPQSLPDSAALTSALAATESRSTWIQQLFQSLVFRSFEPLKRGSLTVRLPDGTRRVFGEDREGPQASIHVRRPTFFRKCVLHGDIGFGEAYQDGDWDSEDLTQVIGWFCANADQAPTLSGSQRKTGSLGVLTLLNRWKHRLRRNSLNGSRRNIQAHYDLGNDFYQLWLDPTLTYSAALFESPEQALSDAQAAKYDRLCRELQLRPTDHVLEIGTGWGGFSCHAVRNYGCRVTTVTISAEQAKLAAERFVREGIADRARVELRDYRQIEGQYDKVASIEMLEAVGDEYLETFFGKLQGWLAPQGIFAAQFITCPDARYHDLRRGVDWIQKHIFPGSLLLSMKRVGEAVQRTGRLELQTTFDFGTDYARTLRHWRERFITQLSAVRDQGFDERFIRTWHYYLAYCEAAFAWRHISVVQATWTKSGAVQSSSPS